MHEADENTLGERMWEKVIIKKSNILIFIKLLRLHELHELQQRKLNLPTKLALALT